MAAAENEALVRRFYEEVWASGNLDVCDEVFECGKVAEIWNHRDDLSLMEQLGAQIYAGAPPEG